MRFHAEQRPGLGEEAGKEEEGDVKLTELDISHIPVALREYRVQSTGARVTLASAKPLLYMFCAKLPADRQAPPPPAPSLPTPGKLQTACHVHSRAMHIKQSSICVTLHCHALITHRSIMLDPLDKHIENCSSLSREFRSFERACTAASLCKLSLIDTPQARHCMCCRAQQATLFAHAVTTGAAGCI